MKFLIRNEKKVSLFNSLQNNMQTLSAAKILQGKLHATTSEKTIYYL